MPPSPAFVLALFVLSIGFSWPRAALAGPGPCTVDPSYGNPVYAEMQTTQGLITLEMWPDIAPCTINNFIAYTNSGRYDGTFIHRSAPGFVIQGGGYAFDSGSQSYSSIPRDPAIVNEPGASNLRATIAMARIGGQINSATSEWFVNLVDNTFLDTVDDGFTVFGRVSLPDMTGTVDPIAALPRVEGRWTLNSALRNVFGELPLHMSPTENPSGYGCFDPNALPQTGISGWLRALVNLAGNSLETDPVAGGPYYLSTDCTGTGATGPPAVSCTVDRQVAYTSNGNWFIDPTNMTCAQIAESEESLAARRDDLEPQISPELVELTTVTIPEPAFGMGLLVGTTALLAAARRRHR